jgi:hypothetical protein
MKVKLFFLLMFIANLHHIAAQSKPTVAYKNYGLKWFPISFYEVDGKAVGNRVAGKVLKSDVEAYTQFKAARKLNRISNVFLGALTVGSVAYELKSDRDGVFDRRDKAVLIGQGVGLISVIAIDLYAMKMHRKAATIYNENKVLGDKSTTPILKFQIKNTGTSICIAF